MISLSYSSMKNMAKISEPTEVYFFILKTTKGKFKIQKPTSCQIQINDKLKFSHYLYFRYKTKAGKWSSTTQYCTKNNAYYFTTLKEAEEAFEESVKSAKEHFTNQINSAKIALSELALY